MIIRSRAKKIVASVVVGSICAGCACGVYNMYTQLNAKEQMIIKLMDRVRYEHHKADMYKAKLEKETRAKERIEDKKISAEQAVIREENARVQAEKDARDAMSEAQKYRLWYYYMYGGTNNDNNK